LQFPYGTLAVNILGCLAIGVIFSLAEKGQPGLQWRSFLVTGICGGYTTFSAFSVETIELIRSGQPGAAVLYIALSVFLGLLATLAGITIVKLF
jgi:fluoride exporter